MCDTNLTGEPTRDRAEKAGKREEIDLIQERDKKKSQKQ
jgi:hypothetical protein